VNSALHSCLILAFTREERVTTDVGFYHMANAAGRLVGTVLSGLTYQSGRLAPMLGTAAVMIALPLAAGIRTRKALGRPARIDAFRDRIKPWSVVGLIATVMILFGLQGQVILDRRRDRFA